MENTGLIKNAVDFAKENYSNTNITVQSVADSAGFSIDYFNRLFLAHTGFTVMSYVNYIRIKNAIVLLRTTEQSVLDIALAVGYDSHEGFIKAFKRLYGTTPSEYRKQKSKSVLSWGELVDSSCINRFLHANPDFEAVDSDGVIDYLLEKDAHKFGYLCTTIKCMGFYIAALKDGFEKGFICIGDDRQGGMWLEIVTDNLDLLCEWLKRFQNVSCFYLNKEPKKVEFELKARGVEKGIKVTPQSLYLKDEELSVNIDDLIIRELSFADRESILQWANGKKDSYIDHLLNEKHYCDDSVLEYGVFKNGELIAVVGCGIDEAHGFAVNNCCNIRFTERKATDSLYRKIYEYVTNDIVNKGILPFDDLQHGDYASSHGDFTSQDVGFTVVNRRYDIE